MNHQPQWPERARRIAVLDPIQRSRELTRRVVRRLGHTPEAFASVTELKAASQGRRLPFDLVWVACGADTDAAGDLLDRVREAVGDDVPMLLSVSRTRRAAIVLLHARACDTVVTPQASFTGLYGTLRSVFECRGFGVASPELAWGPYRFFPMNGTVRIGAEVVHLRPLEFDLAIEFFSHIGRVLSREWLYAMVWDEVCFDTRALDTQVSRLRRKLCRPSAGGWALQSASRVGYRLVAPSPAVDGDGAARAASTSFASEAGLSSGA